MKVYQIMSSPVVTVRESVSLEDVARVMLERRIGCVVVVNDQGALCGIVTDSDFAGKERGFPFSVYRYPQVLGEWLPKEGVERIYQAARTRPVSEIMNPDVVTLPEDASVEEAVDRLLHHDINRIVVVRGDKPVGVVARHDLLRLVLRGGSQGEAQG